MAHKTATQLRTRIERIVKDSSYSNDDIFDLLNRGVDEICERVALPQLATYATLSTGDDVSHVSLPTNFHRGLRRCYSVTNDDEIKIYPSVIWMLEDFEGVVDDTGDVSAVSILGTALHYQGIPTASEELRIYYQQKPTYYSTGSDTTTFIPEWLEYPLLVGFAAKEVFAEIEDGTEPQHMGKVNTVYWTGMYEKALGELHKHVVGRIRPEWKKPDVWAHL